MSDAAAKLLQLLEAYEDFTRRETICLRDETFEPMLRLQAKKASLLESIKRFEKASLDPDVAASCQTRIAALQAQEAANQETLAQKIAANRREYRKLAQGVVSASKLRSAYQNISSAPTQSGTLEGKA